MLAGKKFNKKCYKMQKHAENLFEEAETLMEMTIKRQNEVIYGNDGWHEIKRKIAKFIQHWENLKKARNNYFTMIEQGIWHSSQTNISRKKTHTEEKNWCNIEKLEKYDVEEW